MNDGAEPGPALDPGSHPGEVLAPDTPLPKERSEPGRVSVAHNSGGLEVKLDAGPPSPPADLGVAAPDLAGKGAEALPGAPRPEGVRGGKVRSRAPRCVRHPD